MAGKKRMIDGQKITVKMDVVKETGTEYCNIQFGNVSISIFHKNHIFIVGAIPDDSNKNMICTVSLKNAFES